MSVSVDPCASPPSGTLSCHVTTTTAVVAAITFSASGAAPTPLYHDYQEHFGLTAFMITIIFAAYVLCLLLRYSRWDRCRTTSGPPRGPGCSDAERFGDDPLHNGRLGRPR
jgi:hypothetical protein